MDDLVTWLRDCIDEDFEIAQVANALSASPWTSTGNAVTCGEGFRLARAEDGEPATAEHIARWDPARALAEIEAKRLMLDFLDPTDAPEGEGKYVAERAILLLALPYAGYPGWREEWAL